MQNFGRFLAVGGVIAGGYVFYKLAKEWWNLRNSGPPSVAEASSRSIPEDIAVDFDDDYEERNDCIVSPVEDINALDEASISPDVLEVLDRTTEVVELVTLLVSATVAAENTPPLAEEMLLTDSEIDWKFRNEEMFCQGDIAGAFDFYDEQSIISKMKNAVKSDSKYEVEEKNITESLGNDEEVLPVDDIDTGTLFMADNFTESDTNTSIVTKPSKRKRKRFKNARNFFKSLSCFRKPLTED